VTPADDTQRDVLSAREAAKLLGIGINQVYSAVSRGDIPCRRIGRSLRFSRTALLRWLEGEKRSA
jgi:excisionase family DNA binding protein